MILSLEVRRARKGDCLLLHFGSNEDPGLIMIDGGPKNVYRPHLKPRLEQIRTARGLSNQDSLPVDLLMVSHVDDDHIQGILELTKELIEAQDERRPQLLRVLSFWHNSFDDIIGHKPEELTAAFRSQFGTAAVSGELPAEATIELDDRAGEISEEVVVDNLKVLASIEQGYRLRIDAEKLDFPRNPEFNGKLIIATKNAKAIDMDRGLTFKVVGPLKPEVEALRQKHDQWLRDLKEKGKSPPQALAAYVDKSVPNLSSLVLLAEAKGKRMLLTGDARGDKIIEGLQFVGLLGPGGDSKMHVDVLKVPHHGSANNLEQDFFERITAEHYVFSGDGEHGNPERETLEMLLDARGSAEFTVHLTYPVKEIDEGRREDWTKEQNKERNRKKRPGAKVRPDWSPEVHGLEALFAKRGIPEGKISIVDPHTPHVINLLDAVEF
ncbi:MAG TPA: hypothetical protein VIS96_11165 [Terrimicrobiaceae bacterium]